MFLLTCMVSLDRYGLWCPLGSMHFNTYVAALSITLYRYDLSYHYFGICTAVCGSRSFALIVETVKVSFSRVPMYMGH